MKNSKENRRKLIAAASMLLVATLMLGAVTYAWYTLSTNPEVSNMTVNLDANQNLEIALDNFYSKATDVDDASFNATASGNQGSTTGNPYTWGNHVDLDYAFGTAVKDVISTNGITSTQKMSDLLYLRPAEYSRETGDKVTAASTNAVLKYPSYGADGRISGYQTLSKNNVSDLAQTYTKSTKTWSTGKTYAGVTAYCQSSNVSVLDAFGVTYWLRSNQNCEVTLDNTDSHRAYSNSTNNASNIVNNVSGNGSYIAVSCDSAVSNNVARVIRYLNHLVIRLDVVSGNGTGSVETLYATLSRNNASVSTDTAGIVSTNRTTDGWLKLDLKLSTDKTKNSTTATQKKTLHLNENEAKKVIMTVYLDGSSLTNADALLADIKGMKINLQFQSSAIKDTGTTTSGAMTAVSTNNN